jgi:acyl-CoA reductase-like NAD-dependent aldehyde dehydrogenase
LGDPPGRTFQAVSPATGQVVATFPIHGAAEVAAAVTRARTATTWWAGLGFDGRRRRLLVFKGLLARRADELVDLVHLENGKPAVDGFIEVLPARGRQARLHRLDRDRPGW